MPQLRLITGYHASGKTTLAQQYVDQGFVRINRDTVGGKIQGLIPRIADELSSGNDVVADNTMLTIPDREPFIQLAKDHGAEVHCSHMDTSFEDCQLNACLRQLERRGKILMPEDFKKEKDPNLFPPAALFAAKNKFENKKTKGKCAVPDHPGKQTPKKSHGFNSVEIVPFVRVWPDEYCNSAFIFDADDTLRRSTGPENWPLEPSEVEVIQENVDAIKARIDKEKPKHLLGASNQSTHEKKEYQTPLDVIDACFEKTNEVTGLDVEWMYCPHYRFPVQCYCRKPHPGMGAHWIWKYKLLPSKVTMFGDSTSDGTFAKRCGFNFVHVKEL